jgi:excisionase family DNA binding protein
MRETSHKSRLSETSIREMFATEPWASRFPPILTVQQLAELMQVSPRTVFQWLATGLLNPATNLIGRQRRILRDSAVMLLMENRLPRKKESQNVNQ